MGFQSDMKKYITNMVYIFSEKILQTFLTEYFPLTKLMMNANPVTEIDEVYIRNHFKSMVK